MSISGNGKPNKKPAVTGGAPKPPKPAAAGEKQPEKPAKVIRLPDPVTIADLAKALEQKPFKIIADLMQLGQFQTIRGVVDFETASKVVRMYGCKAEKIT